MLSSLRNVESVTLEFSTDGCVRQLRPELPALIYPQLQSLELSSHDICFIGLDQFIERVTTPKLTHLFLRISLSEECSNIIEFIRRSSCGLSSLVIHSAMPVSTAGLSGLLALVPELTYLELGLACITDEDLLTFSATPSLVPRLETLSIFAYPGHTDLYSDTVLLDILEHRCTNEQLISRLRLVQVDRLITEDVRLNALRSNGLVVVKKDSDR
ncbi:hypothetical protein Moror_11644 [Moniliophthora roreri MCA 2997]|uniref:F-box domain-containing protein n=1 Tax=Moniliophthora roreri (strain MCA 2997) TaxID=1381753 RepID=V2Y6X0_MONRO|nr:hypothetical protein Moror_11644 [Moniliophthora roreri MCA 2997]